nr:NAD(P)-dependent alcohol dehydrogenase [Frankia sp. Cas4]
MHARYGPPEVVGIQEVDKPTAGAGEVLVRVHAATVNRTDCGYRAARPFIMRFVAGLTGPKATILGNEFAGVVEAVGTDVTVFRTGDRVFGYNEGPFGTHAEYLTVHADGPLAQVPAGVTFERAAAATEGAHYALSFINRIPVRDGTQILVNGATGAIGSAAVQLLTCLGAQVTAVCGPDGVDAARGLGADRVIDHTTQDFTRDEHVYDAVFDAVGKSSFGRCRRLLKPRGVYASADSRRTRCSRCSPRCCAAGEWCSRTRRSTERWWSTSGTCSPRGGSGRFSTGNTRWSRSWRHTDTSSPGRRSATS